MSEENDKLDDLIDEMSDDITDEILEGEAGSEAGIVVDGDVTVTKENEDINDDAE